MRKSRFTEEQMVKRLREADRTSVAEVAEKHGVSDETNHVRRRRFGAMTADQYIHARVLKWLARRGLLREADASNEAPSYSASEAMTLAGMQRGTLETAKEPTSPGERAAPELAEPPSRVTDAAVHERFNLHASVHVPAHDDLARERLLPLPRASGLLAGAPRRASRRPRRLPREERRPRARQAARDVARVRVSRVRPRWFCRRATRFFGCTECLHRAIHGERAWCRARPNRMQNAQRRRP